MGYAENIDAVGNARLLISQYHGNTPTQKLVRAISALIDEELVQPLVALENELNLDRAGRANLDYFGERLGVARPSVQDTGTRFGYDVDSGPRTGRSGFDQAPFYTSEESNINYGPLGDETYRRMLKVRATSIAAAGSLAEVLEAARVLWELEARAYDYGLEVRLYGVSTDPVIRALDDDTVALLLGIPIGIRFATAVIYPPNIPLSVNGTTVPARVNEVDLDINDNSLGFGGSILHVNGYTLRKGT